LYALAVAALPLSADAADKKPFGPPPAVSAPLDLQEARSRLEKTQSPPEYAAMLDSFSSALPPSDALALITQSLASVAPENRRPLAVKAGDLALLLGLFGDAASRYADAAALAPAQSPEAGALLIRAARCALAAGDSEKALGLSSGLVSRTDDAALSASARLVVAWALALQGRFSEARSAAVSVAEGAAPAEPRREARFILWLCAVDDASSTTKDNPSTMEEKAKAAAALAAEFPGSLEALIASGAVSAPPLPHWYLGGLGGYSSVTAAPAKSAQVPTSLPAAGSAPLGRSRRLQVGYFSLEDNARALKDELASKGFSASVEMLLRSAGRGKADEKRWTVFVDGGKDIAKAMQSLKDAGYESYIID
jgi:cell division septation protein DedD